MPAYVYLLASRSRKLYVGVTKDLTRRITEHRAACDPNAFTARYRIFHLVHVEVCNRILDAIAREKQIKAWSRAQKLALIEGANPDWQDLMPSEEKMSRDHEGI